MHGCTTSSSAMLRFLSLLYAAAVRARNALYDRGILRSYKTPPVVVSVGNIEAGGTGKTPFTIAISDELSKRGLRVAIVTRGYRGSLTGPVLVKARHRVEEVGDEALLMARISSVPVIKSPNRVNGALFAYTHMDSEIVILDDGFQHRRLHRDLDIVLISRDITNERLLPAGHLREPSSSLKRGHIIIAMKRAPQKGLAADLKPECLIDAQGSPKSLTSLAGQKALAFCAIGNPSHFFVMLEDLGVAVERLAFTDHHRYNRGDIVEIMDKAAGRDIIITTEKDLVKIDPDWFGSLSERLFAVRVTLDMPGLGNIADEIEQLARDRRVPGQG
jgi:tetraacyldisaccharide 4'-kinase